MTREEAWQGLQGYSMLIADGTELKEALHMAIDALQTKSIGEWLPRWGEVECSRCGEFEKKKSNFCPTCGAKMIEEDNYDYK